MSPASKIEDTVNGATHATKAAAESAKDSATSAISNTYDAAVHTAVSTVGTENIRALIERLQVIERDVTAKNESGAAAATAAAAKAHSIAESEVITASKNEKADDTTTHTKRTAAVPSEDRPTGGMSKKSHAAQPTSKNDSNRSDDGPTRGFLSHYFRPMGSFATSIGTTINENRWKSALITATALGVLAYGTGCFDSSTDLMAMYKGAKHGSELKSTVDDATEGVNSAYSAVKDKMSDVSGGVNSTKNTFASYFKGFEGTRPHAN